MSKSNYESEKEMFSIKRQPMKLTKRKFYYCPHGKTVDNFKCPCIKHGCEYKNKKRCNEIYVLKKEATNEQ